MGSAAESPEISAWDRRAFYLPSEIRLAIDIIALDCYMGGHSGGARGIRVERVGPIHRSPFHRSWYDLPCIDPRGGLPLRASVSSRHQTVNREVRHHGAGNRPPRRIRRRSAVRGSTRRNREAGVRSASPTRRRRLFAQRPDVEPDRHPLCRAHWARRQEPYPRQSRRSRRTPRHSPTERSPMPSSSTACRGASRHHNIAACSRGSPGAQAFEGFGYAVMNLGLGSGGSIIHTDMMQGFRPSGVTSEQLTSNF